MTVYEAHKAMRDLTKLGIPFSFSFMSYDRDKQRSKGIVEVRRAKLRKRATADKNANTEIMQEYLDLDTNEPRRFYPCALMFFNGQQLTLK